jgi:outer membrane protein, heavy metal efflux system
VHPTRFIATALALLLAGCATAPREESAALDRVRATGARLRPAGHLPELPVLTAGSSLADYLRFALLKHPEVAAAYDDWRGAALAIAPARALPDPQFTFQADVTDTLMSFMPGLMFDFMTPGKRTAMAREATAASEVYYRSFVSTVLATAADARKAWIDLAFVDESLRLVETGIGSLEQSSALAKTDYATGRGMATLEAQVRLANEIARVHAELDSLGDRRTAARARFKSALGLAPADADPAWPTATLGSTALPSDDELWRRAQASNPELGRMRAMVDMALAGVDVARRAGTPDFTLGAMVDLQADPLMIRPTATITLPIWRKKIAANIAAATARSQAAGARVSAEQLNVVAELAQLLYLVRESDRMIAYLDGTALPNLDRIIASVEASYGTGMSTAAMIPETRRMALGMRRERVAALREREIAATDLMLLTADIVPPGASLLPAETRAAQP